MTQRSLVVDANILIRAVLGVRARQLILDHVGEVSFFAPDTAYAEAREHLPGVLENAGSVGLPRWPFWMRLKLLSARSRPSRTRGSSIRRWPESANAMPTTGRHWLAR